MTSIIGLIAVSFVIAVQGIDVSTGDLRRYLSVGWAAACVLLINNEAVCWGPAYLYSEGSFVEGTNYTTLGDANKVSAFCNIKGDASLECFGYDSHSIISNMPSDKDDSGWTGIAVGETNICGMFSGAINPRTTCWGSNADINSIPDSSTLYELVTVGYDFACGITSNLELECWGDSSYSFAMPSSNYTYVDSGYTFWCALDDDGNINCGGTQPSETAPAESGWSDIALGDDFGCALNATGGATCWGTDHDIMDHIQAKEWVTISAGWRSACGIDWDGELYCYGDNSYGIADGPGNLTEDIWISPTFSPTNPPSQLPTENPTENPSLQPSMHPSETPTVSPTNSPSQLPTESPTENPSAQPTVHPSETPTSYPTTSPSMNPTEIPTQTPSEPPSESPTRNPTEIPTQTPSEAPTTQPTVYPTDSPTTVPSNSPSTLPTESPTGSPTQTPTLIPTPYPTYTPTTSYPSQTPTFQPTGMPTNRTENASFIEFSDFDSWHLMLFIIMLISVCINFAFCFWCVARSRRVERAATIIHINDGYTKTPGIEGEDDRL